MSLQLTPDFISNPRRIVDYCLNNPHVFTPRINERAHVSGTILPVPSRFHTLFVTNAYPANHEMFDWIFNDSKFDNDVRTLCSFIQIQWYKPGDYIVPHRDVYAIQKLHLITLTSSDVDSLVVQNGDTLVRIPDVAGQKVDFDYDAFHWVDPCMSNRFSIVIGE